MSTSQHVTPTNKLFTKEARRLFLERIQKRQADLGKPLSGFALEYWRALESENQEIVDQLWKDRKRRGELDAIEKEFEAALHDALRQDVTRDPSTIELYLSALDGIKSVQGVQLQALVFAAAMRVEALQTPNRAIRIVSIAAIAIVLLVGIWIGAHFVK